MTTETTTHKRQVQIDLGAELIAELDRLAAEEGLARATYVRHQLHKIVKSAKLAEAR
jgi:predicted DNA binding CopG/RHH family protein